MKKTKFEKMLEHLVNEDRAGAEKLFHEIVVERSRKIYESLLEDEFEDLDDEDDGDFGGDPTDELESDVEYDDDDDVDNFDDNMDGEEDLEDRVVDLEDALDDLKAEFERLMSDDMDDDTDGEEFGDDTDGEEFDDMDGDSEEFGDDTDGEEFDDMDDDSEELKDDVQTMREYVEKVANPTPGDNGAYTRSAVASSNNMGGTTANIVRTDTDNKGMKKTTPKVDNAGNRNVPGGKAGKLNSAPKAKMGPSDSEKSMIGSRKRKS